MEFEIALALGFVLIGIIMLVLEAASPGAFIIVPATVLLVLGAIGLVYPELLMSWWSPIIALAVLLPVTYVTIKTYQRIAPPAPPETTISTSLVGRTGKVTIEVDSDSIKGKVKIGNDTWSATSKTTIPVGTKVRVVGSEGVHVWVEEISEAS